ncbi:translation initiation factor eIF-2B subunit beta-like [Pyrus ussuriensis x Pyrus communis]|uniref:Translation initiation factor eIF2B subunit beta n=1 Tax=Pyrus ussuriensis x Pyrus communis TaxID=2448454 RepID=A0A5N5HCF1_9ROSA|nr:translation initiation factor eIF-2B subunit beta-like [Pyrus ussuriensis x Pyrus communis]
MADVQGLVSPLFINFCGGRKVECSRETARLTVELLRTVISAQKLPSPTNLAAALIEAVRGVGQRLIAANPVDIKTLHVIVIVYHTRLLINKMSASILQGPFTLFLSTQGRDRDSDEGDDKPFLCLSLLLKGFCVPLHWLIFLGPKSLCIVKYISLLNAIFSLQLTKVVTEAVNDLIEDIKTCHEQIADLMVELIHQKTVKKFLCAAKKKRPFQVFVAEGAPKYLGHVIVKELAAKGIQITMITNSSVFAMISRVNMVIVGVHAVTANGGVIASVGTYMVALAAKKHAVPFVVNPLSFGEISDFMDFSIGSVALILNVVNPAFDYVPPKLVSFLLLICKTIRGPNPSYIHRLISDFYSADDLGLHQKPAS